MSIKEELSKWYFESSIMRSLLYKHNIDLNKKYLLRQQTFIECCVVCGCQTPGNLKHFFNISFTFLY